MKDSIERIYAVELLFENKPKFSKAALLAALRHKCPDIEPLSKDMNSDLLAFVHPNHLSHLKDASIPAQLVVFPGDRECDHLSIEPSIEQSWLFPSAREVVPTLRHKVLVNDLMAGGVPYKERLGIFLDALEGMVMEWECQAIHWRQSQQVVSRDFFLKSRRDPEQHVLQGGPINARFFNVANAGEDGQYVVDTMGLAVFGLPDIQCHFRGLDVESVVDHVYNLAIYLYENGDVIGDGHTVPGIRDGRNWVCQHEESLVSPDRVVLDLNPGAEFAAGDRV